ncbi:MAG: tRNA (guanosine(37)-N1)-methyltransferase TrmD, partial [Actinomyces sp.]|nr:tRNA (guanosine(37)-N1)-methyltransferase TrmD [Actinomyces sp.]
MRFDLISIFPDYFAPLRLSLMGKAEDAGLVQLHAHDLRDWATGKHRSVDDTPYGGGAGMVMRADVWARALDDVLCVPLAARGAEDAPASPRRVLAIPTPSGAPLTQPRVEDLARADQIIVACGRYEGIDARVAEHYHGVGVEVVEFSIGDYVLNGGEVAAMVLTEAVARLLDGFMGNPDSLVEESHSGAGLLEYPVFTKPREFRSLEIPEVLLGGNHAAIERWRRDRAIEKTARVRPDLALSLDASSLTREDRAMLARCGIAYPRAGAAERLDVRQAELEDVVAVSELAARTFPDACPANLPQEAIAEHIATQLSAHPSLLVGHRADDTAAALLGSESVSKTVK